MSDPLPPLPPVPSEPPQPHEPNYNPPDFWLMFFLGIGLCIVSGVLCFAAQSPSPVGLAALGAFVSLFFRGWRGLFVGYFTLIGLLVLAVIVICGTGIVPPFRE